MIETAPSPALDTAVIVSHVRAGYGQPDVLIEVSLELRRGELVALVGPNGAGKSTLLKLLVGLLRPRAGEVRVLDRVPGKRTPVAYLPQAEALRWDFPLSVEDVVLTGLVPALGIGRRPGRSERAAVRAALDRVSATYLLARTAGELSGGERQRVLLARTLLAAPEIYLLDEPATGVDPTTEEQLMAVLEDISAAGKTVLVATHDLAGVMAHFRRVVCLNRRIVADGDVSLLRDDAVLRATYGGHRPEEPRWLVDEHHA